MVPRSRVSFFLLLVGALAEDARQLSLETVWSRELEPEVKTYKSPVKRVTNLLKKMKAELLAEGDKEAEMYDKMVCWCETNEKEKKKAVADAEAADQALSTEIEGRSARLGELSASIENTKKEIVKNTATLKEATAIREAEASKFRGVEKDLVQAVTNLRNAIAVLSKHQKTQSLLQMDGPLRSGVRVLLRDVALRYEEMLAGREERRSFESSGQGTALVSLQAEVRRMSEAHHSDSGSMLLGLWDSQDVGASETLPLKYAERIVAKAASQERSAAQGSKFLQVDAGQPLYESRSSHRSAGIYGILTQMQEEFEAELTMEQKEELKAAENYKALAAAKSAEIEAGKQKLDEMQMEDSANQKALSDAREVLTETREQRSADVKFLKNLQGTCNDLDTQWEKRSQTRAAELKAVSEAIVILTQDDNREMLAKSVTLLQEKRLSASASSEAADSRRVSAVAVLRHAAQDPSFAADDLLAAWHARQTPTLGAVGGPRAQLSTLAMAVQLDSFTKVKEMIDKMLVHLKEEQEEEVELKAYCKKELKENARTTYTKTELKKDLEAKIERLEVLIEKLEGEIAEAKKQKAATTFEIKKASQNREAENSEFQVVVADQRVTQSILTKALQKLKDFYEKGIGNVVFAQQGSVQEPPVKFNSYKTNQGGSTVVGLVEQILEDSRALETETISAETKAQADYEQFVKDSNDLNKSLDAAVATKAKAVAAAKGDIAEATASKESTEDELESLAAYKADLHMQCDFVLKNFDIRQKARTQEMEAIQAAKAILSGAGR